MQAIENGIDVIFTPNLIQIIKQTNRGSKHKMVNTVLTAVEGLLSGSLNSCVISGLGRLFDEDFREVIVDWDSSIAEIMQNKYVSHHSPQRVVFENMLDEWPSETLQNLPYFL